MVNLLFFLHTDALQGHDERAEGRQTDITRQLSEIR